VDLVREVLDKSVVDRNGREMGRADGIVLALRDGQPPCVEAILIGPIALGDRLHPAIGRLVRALEKRMRLDARRPVHIDFGDITAVDRNVKVRLAISDTAAEAVEQRLRRWILKVPGSR